jgi:hypothetical protein
LQNPGAGVRTGDQVEVAGRCVNRIALFCAQWFSVMLAVEVEDEVVFEIAA